MRNSRLGRRKPDGCSVSILAISPRSEMPFWKVVNLLGAAGVDSEGMGQFARRVTGNPTSAVQFRIDTTASTESEWILRFSLDPNLVLGRLLAFDFMLCTAHLLETWLGFKLRDSSGCELTGPKIGALRQQMDCWI